MVLALPLLPTCVQCVKFSWVFPFSHLTSLKQKIHKFHFFSAVFVVTTAVAVNPKATTHAAAIHCVYRSRSSRPNAKAALVWVRCVWAWVAIACAYRMYTGHTQSFRITNNNPAAACVRAYDKCAAPHNIKLCLTKTKTAKKRKEWKGICFIFTFSPFSFCRPIEEGPLRSFIFITPVISYSTRHTQPSMLHAQIQIHVGHEC